MACGISDVSTRICRDYSLESGLMIMEVKNRFTSHLWPPRAGDPPDLSSKKMQLCIPSTDRQTENMLNDRTRPLGVNARARSSCFKSPETHFSRCAVRFVLQVRLRHRNCLHLIQGFLDSKTQQTHFPAVSQYQVNVPAQVMKPCV